MIIHVPKNTADDKDLFYEVPDDVAIMTEEQADKSGLCDDCDLASHRHPSMVVGDKNKSEIKLCVFKAKAVLKKLGPKPIASPYRKPSKKSKTKKEKTEDPAEKKKEEFQSLPAKLIAGCKCLDADYVKLICDKPTPGAKVCPIELGGKEVEFVCESRLCPGMWWVRGFS